MDARNRYASFLAWAYEGATDPEESSSSLDPDIWMADCVIPENAGRKVISTALSEALIRPTSIADTQYRLTPVGFERAAAIAARQQNRPLLNDQLRTDLVQWLYHEYHNGVRAADMVEFLRNEPAFEGRRYTAAETLNALSYLEGKSMATMRPAPQPPGEARTIGRTLRPLTHALILDRGIDCAESGLTVARFIHQTTSTGGPMYQVHITDSQGVIIGQQSNFTQNNTSGLDTSALVHFAGLARQSAPALGLTPEQQVDVERAAEELHAEAIATEPDRGRLRRFADWLLSAVGPAAGTALGQVVLEAGNQAVGALSG